MYPLLMALTTESGRRRSSGWRPFARSSFVNTTDIQAIDQEAHPAGAAFPKSLREVCAQRFYYY
jgi:hypothetical protein